jgi:coenzyme F420 biosynthesis associated uncharacterized protein
VTESVPLRDESFDDPDDAPTGLPVDWGLAVRTAARLLPPGPEADRAEAQQVVIRLRSDAADAEQHVRTVTGLGGGLPLLPADVVDRPAWTRAAVDGMAALTAGARLPLGSPAARRFTATTAGLQLGAVLGYLGGRVLGQYDPFGGAAGTGRLALVAPNIVAAQRALDVPADDFGLWVCLHEATHRLQFTAVPWLGEHFAAEIGKFLTLSDASAAGMLERLPAALRAARKSGGDSFALIEMLQGPQQRLVLDRLLAMLTLLEGHADHVMDAVGPSVIPSVAIIRERFTARRRGGGVLDRLLRALLGVEAKVRQYAVGAKFTKHVVDEVGMSGFNRVWTAPETLPSRAELADPAAWLHRVRP